MQLYFIRHAESENNALYANTGSWIGRKSDPSLTDTGREQAAILARYLVQNYRPEPNHDRDIHNHHGYHFTHLYCSLMERAILTGQALSEALDLPLVGWEEIHEHGGIFHRDEETEEHIGLPGRNRHEFGTLFPALHVPDHVQQIGWWNRPYEDWADVPARAELFLHALLEKHGGTDDRVAIVSHGGFYQAFLGAIVGLPLPRTGREAIPRVWFAINNTAISRFDFTERGVNPTYLNRVDHLAIELVT